MGKLGWDFSALLSWRKAWKDEVWSYLHIPFPPYTRLLNIWPLEVMQSAECAVCRLVCVIWTVCAMNAVYSVCSMQYAVCTVCILSSAYIMYCVQISVCTVCIQCAQLSVFAVCTVSSLQCVVNKCWGNCEAYIRHTVGANCSKEILWRRVQGSWAKETCSRLERHVLERHVLETCE